MRQTAPYLQYRREDRTRQGQKYVVGICHAQTGRMLRHGHVAELSLHDPTALPESRAARRSASLAHAPEIGWQPHSGRGSRSRAVHTVIVTKYDRPCRLHGDIHTVTIRNLV